MDNLFLFGEDIVIDPRGYLVVAGDSELFQNEHGSGIYFTGSFNSGDTGFRLSNEGESIILKNNDGELEDIVQYDNQAPWPTAADGMGPSLQLLAPDLDNNHYSNWFASSGTPYSPGAENGGNSSDETRGLQDRGLHVYPNPAGKELFMEFNEEPGTRMEMGIFSLSGSRLDGFIHYAAGGFETVSWQHQVAQPGAYILRILVTGQSDQYQDSHLLILTGLR
jgi:hypothetical protein